MKKLLEKFKKAGSKEPVGESDILGLVVDVQKKESTLQVGYPAEGTYYQVTVKSTGQNDDYPANECIWTRNYTRLISAEDRHGANTTTDFIPSTEAFSKFSLLRKSDEEFQLVVSLQQASGKKIKNGTVSISRGIPNTLAKAKPQASL
jgi:hypothetical protein